MGASSSPPTGANSKNKGVDNKWVLGRGWVWLVHMSLIKWFLILSHSWPSDYKAVSLLKFSVGGCLAVWVFRWSRPSSRCQSTSGKACMKLNSEPTESSLIPLTEIGESSCRHGKNQRLKRRADFRLSHAKQRDHGWTKCPEIKTERNNVGIRNYNNGLLQIIHTRAVEHVPTNIVRC